MFYFSRFSFFGLYFSGCWRTPTLQHWAALVLRIDPYERFLPSLLEPLAYGTVYLLVIGILLNLRIILLKVCPVRISRRF